MFKKALIFSALAGTLSGQTYAFGNSGLKFSAAVDVTTSRQLKKNDPKVESLAVREGELIFYGPIDHMFDGKLNIAVHGSEAEVHEAYLRTSKIIPGTELTIGKFLPVIGRQNKFHRHDWLTTDNALVLQEIFGTNHSLMTNGIQLNRIFDLGAPIEFNLGYGFAASHGESHEGHDHASSEEHEHKLSYSKDGFIFTRISSFFNIGTTSGVEFGTSYLRRKDAEKHGVSIFGIDSTLKLKTGKVVTTLVQLEAWLQDGEEIKNKGVYLTYQRGFSTAFSAGLRLDYNLKDVHTHEGSVEHKEENHEFGGVVFANYAPSEFSRIRFSYSHLEDVEKVGLQFTFFLGSHPTHSF